MHHYSSLLHRICRAIDRTPVHLLPLLRSRLMWGCFSLSSWRSRSHDEKGSWNQCVSPVGLTIDQAPERINHQRLALSSRVCRTHLCHTELAGPMSSSGFLCPRKLLVCSVCRFPALPGDTRMCTKSFIAMRCTSSSKCAERGVFVGIAARRLRQRQQDPGADR